MSFCFLYNVVSENHSVQNSPWGGGGGGGGSIASSRSTTTYTSQFRIPKFAVQISEFGIQNSEL